MDFYFNDVYPNQGFVNTRNQTIPEVDDREALAENKEASLNAKTTPKERKSIYLALAVFLLIAVGLGVLK